MSSIRLAAAFALPLALAWGCGTLPEAGEAPPSDASAVSQRQEMVQSQLQAAGIHDRRVLEAMGAVPREAFLPEPLRHLAYMNRALEFEGGRVLPTPYLSAFMLQALRLQGGEKVLELGAARGYHAALLARAGAAVFAVEASPDLCNRAEWEFKRLAGAHPVLRCGNPALGWPEQAPFDRIFAVEGAALDAELLSSQLKPGGSLVFGPAPGARAISVMSRISQSGLQKEMIPF